jgi:hypothetical protein
MAMEYTRGARGRSVERLALGIDRDTRMYNERDPNEGSVLAATHPYRTFNAQQVRALASGVNVLQDNIPADVVGGSEIQQGVIGQTHLAFNAATNPHGSGQHTGNIGSYAQISGTHGNAEHSVNYATTELALSRAPSPHAANHHTGTIGSYGNISGQHGDADHAVNYSRTGHGHSGYAQQGHGHGEYAFDDHTHSTSHALRFEALPEAARQKMLDARRTLQKAIRGEGALGEEELKALLTIILGDFHISYDGITETAEERQERRSKSPGYEKYMDYVTQELYGNELLGGTTTFDPQSRPIHHSLKHGHLQRKVDPLPFHTLKPRFAREAHPDLQV